LGCLDRGLGGLTGGLVLGGGHDLVGHAAGVAGLGGLLDRGLGGLAGHDVLVVLVVVVVGLAAGLLLGPALGHALAAGLGAVATDAAAADGSLGPGPALLELLGVHAAHDDRDVAGALADAGGATPGPGAPALQRGALVGVAGGHVQLVGVELVV